MTPEEIKHRIYRNINDEELSLNVKDRIKVGWLQKTGTILK